MSDIKPIEIQLQDRKITLIPTAHVSKESAEMTAALLEELNPDCICIELDQDRYNSLKNPDKYRNTDISKIIKDKKVAFMLVNLILGHYQKKMATQLGSTSGQEMRLGIAKSEKDNIPLVLADRSVQTTFKRIWAAQTLKDKFKLLTVIISSLFDDEEVSEEDLTRLQQSDALNAALGEVSKQFPAISEVLVTERDKYLAHKIKNAPGNNVVAILGAAHTIGIQKYIHEDYSIDEYDTVPPKKTSSKIIGWIIPVAIITAIILSFNRNADLGFANLKKWFIVNGGLSGLGVLLAGGHVLSILTAVIAAPFTSLNPLLASGWFAGLVEARIKKPTVADFDDLNEDLNSLKGFWKNKVTRILLIVILANLGSTIGTIIGSIDIIKNLFD